MTLKRTRQGLRDLDAIGRPKPKRGRVGRSAAEHLRVRRKRVRNAIVTVFWVLCFSSGFFVACSVRF